MPETQTGVEGQAEVAEDGKMNTKKDVSKLIVLRHLLYL